MIKLVKSYASPQNSQYLTPDRKFIIEKEQFKTFSGEQKAHQQTRWLVLNCWKAWTDSEGNERPECRKFRYFEQAKVYLQSQYKAEEIALAAGIERGDCEQELSDRLNIVRDILNHSAKSLYPPPHSGQNLCL